MAAKYSMDKIREYYEQACQRAQAERYAIERDAFRNVLYMLGIQWITYSSHARKWKPRRIAKWVPRPVTNKFASIAATIIQVLSQKEPSVQARAGTANPDDLAAALIADKAIPVLLKEANSDEVRSLAAAWLALTGTVILHPCYDNDPIHGTTFYQNAMCQNQGCPEFMKEKNADQVEIDSPCPVCGQPAIGAVDPETGEPSGEELPTGKLNIEVFSVFDTYLDLEGKSSSDLQQITVRRRYPIDVIRRKFNRPELEPDNNSNTGGALGLNLLRALAYAAGNGDYGSGIAAGRSLGDDQSITIDMQWVRPCTDFPQGLVTYWANNELLNEKDVKDGIPYRDQDGKPLWPWHLIKFDEVPGRTFGRTPLDDVAPKQEQRNKLEALIQLIITRMANPVWLIPKNLGITEITGEPGQVIEGNWGMTGSAGKPERVPGENVPTSLIAWLEKIDADMSEVAGVFEVLKGSAPTGITAGTALRLLLERALTRYTPVAARYEKGWEGVVRDLVTIFQQFGVDERVMKIAGPGNTWEIEKFSRSNIQGSIDIIVEAGSSLPKSQVGEQALIQDLMSMGVVDPTNPETQYKILERFGSTDLLGDTDANIRYAQRENWDLENEDMPPEIDLFIDLHPVHIIQHKQLALKSGFKTWPEEKKMILRQHILDHEMAAMPQQMATPAEAEMMAAAGGAGQQQLPSVGGDKQRMPGLPPDIGEAPMPGGIM